MRHIARDCWARAKINAEGSFHRRSVGTGGPINGSCLSISTERDSKVLIGESYSRHFQVPKNRLVKEINEGR